LFAQRLNAPNQRENFNNSTVSHGIYTFEQGRNEGGKVGTIPRAPNYLRGRRMAAVGVEKTQECRKYFLQYSTFDSEISVSNMGAPSFLP